MGSTIEVSVMSKVLSIIAILVMAMIGCVSNVSAYGADITQDSDQSFVDMNAYNVGDSLYVGAYNLAAGATLEITRQPVNGQLYEGKSLATATFKKGCGCSDSVYADAFVDITEGSLVAIKNGAVTLVAFQWKEAYSDKDIRVYNNGTVEILDAMG